jgi:hypothetical protein
MELIQDIEAGGPFMSVVIAAGVLCFLLAAVTLAVALANPRFRHATLAFSLLLLGAAVAEVGLGAAGMAIGVGAAEQALAEIEVDPEGMQVLRYRARSEARWNLVYAAFFALPPLTIGVALLGLGLARSSKTASATAAAEQMAKAA